MNASAAFAQSFQKNLIQIYSYICLVIYVSKLTYYDLADR